MFAVILINNRQFMVSKGDTITLQGNLGRVGETIDVDDILFHSKNGVVMHQTPLVKVATKITSITRSKKISVKTYKRRKGYRKQYGSRHFMTSLEITSIATTAS